MNWAGLRLLYIHEMRMILRSPRTIMISLLLPAILRSASTTETASIRSSR